jgi:HD-GYP domain-containing protein (c-di-GMP phosphodiesterase class II)/tetratricopeptide (TPR) repeat protein
MNKEDSLGYFLSGDAAEIGRALNEGTPESTASLFKGLAGCLARAMQEVDDSNHASVSRLTTILMSMNGRSFLESRIRLLVDACFYFTRIGNAFKGIPIALHAKDLASTHELKDLERFATNALGLAYADGACFEEACQALERTLVLARELGEPELECLAMTNTAMLLKEMGLYQDAIEVTDKALAFGLTSDRGRYMSLGNAIHGLFSAHRLRNDEAALRYLRIGSDVLEDNPMADIVQKAGFEYFRAMYLLSTDDHETAEVLIDAAKKRAVKVRNARVHMFLDIASALCDWASREPDRERRARKQLLELYQTSKKTRIHHDDVLRALIEVHKRTLTGEISDLDRKYAKHPEDVGSGLDALSRIVTQTARTGIDFAKELVEFNTGPNPSINPSKETTQYVAGVKNAKFYRQMNDRGVTHSFGKSPEKAPSYDPFAGARAWLGDSTPSSTIANIGNPGVSSAPAVEQTKVIKKHDELTAIHGDMAALRIQSLKATMRTAAYDVAENWALTAEFFDDQTGEHCFRVGRLAGLLAAEIGIDAENCLRIEHAARLHDIGKIAVNELILLKPGPLDSNEIIAMRAHTEVGAQLLEHSDDPTLKMAAAIAKYHHAWWNGAGYPNTSGESIPLAARICAYADVYDALTNERPYKRPWPHKLAVEQMMCESGAHFDPRLMRPFLAVLERHIGSNAKTPSTRMHLQDMEANGLLTSRRKLMETVQAG